jgi:dipeptidyl aminopeptidase/acylaminoacyl peptidase
MVGDQSDTIYVMNADGANKRKLTRTASFDLSPAWSPDGRTVAFASSRAGTVHMGVRKAGGTRPRRSTRVDGEYTDWSDKADVTPEIGSYGLGLTRFEQPCPLFGHDGGIFGYQTFAAATGDGQRAIVLVVNRSGLPWDIRPTVQRMLCNTPNT